MKQGGKHKVAEVVVVEEEEEEERVQWRRRA